MRIARQTDGQNNVMLDVSPWAIRTAGLDAMDFAERLDVTDRIVVDFTRASLPTDLKIRLAPATSRFRWTLRGFWE